MSLYLSFCVLISTNRVYYLFIFAWLIEQHEKNVALLIRFTIAINLLTVIDTIAISMATVNYLADNGGQNTRRENFVLS